MNPLYSWLGKPVFRYEKTYNKKDPTKPLLERSVTFGQDPFFFLLAYVGFYIGALLAPVAFFLFLLTLIVNVIFILPCLMVAGLTALCFLGTLIAFVFNVKGRKSEIITRRFASGTTIFYDTPVLSIPFFMKVGRIQGAPDFTVSSSTEEGGQRLHAPVRLKPGTKNKEFFFFSGVLQMVVYIDVFEHPLAAVKKWQLRLENRRCTADQMRALTQKEILEVALPSCDEILQKKGIDELTGDIITVNTEVFAHLQNVLSTIGVALLQLTIDTTKDEYIRKRGEAAQAVINSETRQTIAQSETAAANAEATQDAERRMTRSAQNQRAFEAEQVARQAMGEAEQEATGGIADAKSLALEKVKPAVQKEAEISQLFVIERMKAVQGRNMDVMIAQIMAMNDAQWAEFIQQVPDSLKSNVTHLGILGEGDPAKAHPIVAFLDRITSMLTTKPAVTIPAPVAPPTTPVAPTT